MHRKRAAKLRRLIDERPRTAYELAQELWGNVAVTQAFLTLSEVVGHVDLLIDGGRRARGRRRRPDPLRGDRRGRRGYDPAVSAPTRSTTPDRVEPSRNGGGEPVRPRKKRMLIIVNPYATTVSDRLKNLVVYALQGRYEVEAVSTEAQNHATEIGREAIDGGYDLVVAFGGDGTLNEIANGLAGTDVPVSILPGGSTNVVARTLGIPNDVVDATEHLLGLADAFEPRPIDLGIANGRRFVFSCGSGLDATAAMRVDRNPKLKARDGPVLLHLGRGLGLLPRLPARPDPDAIRDRRPQRRGGHGPGPELGPVHLLRQAPGAGLRGDRDRRRHALGRGPAPRRPARHGPDRRQGARRAPPRLGPPPDRPLRRRHRGAP